MNNGYTENKMGLSALFQQDPAIVAGTSTPYPLMDFTTIEERSLAVDDKQETIMDDGTGYLEMRSVIQNANMRKYEITTPNTSLRILGMLYRSLPPAAPAMNISSGTFTSVPHTLFSGSPVQIVDANGNDVVMVASITSVTITAGSTVLVRSVDYDYTAFDLQRGIIRMLPGSTLVTGAAGVAATISGTTTAVTGNVQLVPSSGPCVVKGAIKIFFASCGVRLLRERGRCCITIPSLDLNPEKIARVKPVIQMISDPTVVSPIDVTGLVGYPTA